MSMRYGSIQFQADEDFNSGIVAGLRQKRPHIDIITAKDADLLHAPDPIVLAYAADHDRILLSHDVTTMPVHFDDFNLSGRESPGLMLIAQEVPVGRAIDAILFVWDLSELADWRNQRLFLPL